MNREEIETIVLEVMLSIIPEMEPSTLDARVSFRDQVEMDSVDYLNFVLTLEKRLGIRIPEIDYPRLSSLDGSIAYLLKVLAEGTSADPP
ncbi:MAG: acyl carrier protein [Candidatus Thiodiazotropha sp.]